MEHCEGITDPSNIRHSFSEWEGKYALRKTGDALGIY